MLRALGRGVLVGLAWGVTARIFMRLVSTSPEFSWPGTLAIVGMSAVFWGGIGLVAGAREAQRSRWWRLAPLAGLLLFASPGMVLLPGAAGTAVAIGSWRRRGPGALVVGLVALAAGLTVTVLAAGSGDEVAVAPPTAGAGVALIVVATVWLGVGLWVWWRRWVPSAERPAALEGPASVSRPSAYDLG